MSCRPSALAALAGLLVLGLAPRSVGDVVLESLELPGKKEGGRYVRSAFGKDSLELRLRAAVEAGLRSADVLHDDRGDASGAERLVVQVTRLDQDLVDRSLFSSQDSWIDASAEVVAKWGESSWSGPVRERLDVPGRPYKADIQRAWTELFARIGRDVGARVAESDEPSSD